MLSKKHKMSNENGIKLLIENSKIGKQLKEKLIAFGAQKDMIIIAEKTYKKVFLINTYSNVYSM